jgi:Mrp family chromosome partitioning ATPase
VRRERARGRADEPELASVQSVATAEASPGEIEEPQIGFAEEDGDQVGHAGHDVVEVINEALGPRQSLPGFADPRMERVNPIELPSWFVDRCRRAYLSVSFDPNERCRVLGITSTNYGEGKDSIAIGIATAMAVDSKKPTLLLELDLGEPSLYRFLGIDSGRGLSEWLDGDSRLRIVKGAALVPNLFIVPAGAAQDEPARFFHELVDRDVMLGMKQVFANVVLDLPPTLTLSYAPLAYALADRLLMVARSGVTPTDDLEASVRLIGKERLNGIVLNGTDSRLPRWLRALL